MDFISLLENEYKLDTSKKGKIELYQSFQSKDVFNCDYIISFIGEPNDKARFIGIYDVIGKKNIDIDISIKDRESVFAQEADTFYELKKRRRY